MQTEQNKQEPQQAPQKEEGKKLPRKEQLLAKKAKNHDRLPKKEQEELDEILAAEKAEHDRAAVLHRLSSAADTYGRKSIARRTREVTDKVKSFAGEEQKEVEQQLRARKTAAEAARDAAKREMKRVQEELNAKLKQVESDSDGEISHIRLKYRDQYREAESEIQGHTDDVTTEVAEFVETIQSLDLERLLELEKQGTVQLPSDSASTIFLVVPGRPDPS